MSSASPAPPTRIRFITHPPLIPLRAWLPVPHFATIADLIELIRAMLPGRPSLEVELMGFALLPSSSSEILDASNDILDVKAAEPGAASTSRNIIRENHNKGMTPSKIRRASVSSSSSDSTSSSSSSASSSSSSAPETDSDENSSEEDGSPTTMSTKLCESETGRGKASKSKKRPRSTSASPSSSDESNSSDSSSSSEKKREPGPGNAPILHNGVKRSSVPPGQGLKKTKSRNQRRRTFRQARSSSAKVEIVVVDGAKDSEKASVASHGTKTVYPASTSTPIVPINPKPKPKPKPKLVPDPNGEAFGPKLDMLHLASGNKNKRKSLRLSNGSKQPAAKRLFFDDPQRVVSGLDSPSDEVAGWTSRSKVSGPSSPTFEPASPIAMTAPPVPTKQHDSTLSTLSNGIHNAITANVIPSQRSDLPPNLVVTMVDVEGKGWHPGSNEVVGGTSLEWKGEWPISMDSTAATQKTDLTFETWPWTYKQIDQQLNSGSLKVLVPQDAKAGISVAMRVLELDAFTFQPTLSLKYGRLSASNSATLRIELHPDCQVLATKEEELQEQGEYEGDELIKPRLKFGQRLTEDDTETDNDPSIWEGEWADVRLLQ